MLDDGVQLPIVLFPLRNVGGSSFSGNGFRGLDGYQSAMGRLCMFTDSQLGGDFLVRVTVQQAYL
jgi:hypothetical protein